MLKKICIVLTLINLIIMLSNYFFCKNKLNVNIKFLGFDKKVFKEILGYSFFIFLEAFVDNPFLCIINISIFLIQLSVFIINKLIKKTANK